MMEQYSHAQIVDFEDARKRSTAAVKPKRKAGEQVRERALFLALAIVTLCAAPLVALPPLTTSTIPFQAGTPAS